MSSVAFTEQTSTDASQKTTSTLKILKADQANRTWTDHALARPPLREARPQPCRTTPRLLRPLRVAGFPSGCFLLSESQMSQMSRHASDLAQQSAQRERAAMFESG